MQTNPNAKRILVFGDSNTYGAPPTKRFRFDPNVRYTGLLQNLLGENYEVIEEGLPGRTLCATDEESKAKGRVGIDFLGPCFETHAPIDLLVINLGTNELKNRFKLSVEGIRDNLAKLCNSVLKKHDQLKEKERTKNFEILIIAPGYVNESLASEEMIGAEKLSKEIAPLFEKYANKNGYHFLDIGPVAETGVDGCHYTENGHKKIAEVLAEKIKTIF